MPTRAPSPHTTAPNLPESYDTAFERLLEAVASATPDPHVPIAPFWPLRGRRYRSELLVVGRSVNGWVEDWTVGQLRDPAVRRHAVAQMRRDAQQTDRDRMAWVEDLWGTVEGYNTRRSAFWRVLRRLLNDDIDVPGWPGQLVWTNLYKASPAAGWNPGADLQRVQRPLATDLLKIELNTFAPRRVLAMTGDWIRPFQDQLGLSIQGRSGLVDGAGYDAERAWVIAKHPMGKPENDFVASVRTAFVDLGVPLP
jgi:hypothetical protein